jgi:hypothetical protein
LQHHIAVEKQEEAAGGHPSTNVPLATSFWSGLFKSVGELSPDTRRQVLREIVDYEQFDRCVRLGADASQAGLKGRS